MPCYRPISAHSEGINPKTGKKIIVFNKKAEKGQPNAFNLPCGSCLGCGLEKARQWTIRCAHEAQMWHATSFITLTYSPENLPVGGSITPYDFQCFIKRLRKRLKGKKISYFHCGEYGTKLGRPHYHALIYGHDFPDRILWKTKPFPVYTSAELSTLWPYGFSTVGHLTPESIAYVARYTLKKVYGKHAKKHYGDKHPEYITMSRKPAIGKCWYDKYKSDIYPQGIYVSRGGYKTTPPKYYDRLYQLENPAGMEQIKLARKRHAEHNTVKDYILGKSRTVSNADSYRLPVREQVRQSKINLYKRTYEEQ